MVYKVPCGSRDMSYIGETGQTLQLRMKEHKRALTNSALREYKNYKSVTSGGQVYRLCVVSSVNVVHALGILCSLNICVLRV